MSAELKTPSVSTNGQSDSQNRYAQIRKVTLVGAIVNALLALSKITVGYLSQSQALVADGVHSIADLVSDGVVLYAAKHSTKEADEDHPYGHGRIETVVSVALGVFLVAVGGLIMFDALARIADPEKLMQPGMLALAAAFVSIVANEGLFHYTIAVAKKIRSSMLHANAWHHRTDAISSVIALVGIGGTMVGFAYLDAVAAVGVSLMIAKVGFDIAWNALRELVDTALDAEKVREIEAKILEVDGVKEIHMLRTRSHSGMAFVDVHILVENPYISVSEGHHISETVLRKLIREVDEVGDVTVHIDPEDDETKVPNKGLPLRKDVLQRLHKHWEKNPLHKDIKQVILHYLGGKIYVEIVLPLEVIRSADDGKSIAHQFSLYARQEPVIEEIKVRFGDAP